MLTQISNIKKKNLDVSNLHYFWSNYRIQLENYKFNFNECLSFLHKRGLSRNSSFQSLLIYKYGFSSDKKKQNEVYFVQILTIIAIFIFFIKQLKRLKQLWLEDEEKNIPDFFYMLSLKKREIRRLFLEFQVERNQLNNIDQKIKNYTHLEECLIDYQKTIAEVPIKMLDNVPEEKASPIAQLLNPNLKEVATLKGYANEVYNELEKVPKSKRNHLSKTDKEIFDQSLNYLKMLKNKTVRHKNETIVAKVLTEELFHLCGAVAALLQKLLHQK